MLNQRVVYLTFDELAERLGIPGEITHVWREGSTDYVHIVTADPSFPPRARGGTIATTHIHSLPKEG